MDNQKSSNKTWYIIGIVIIIALAFWYFSTKSPSTTAPAATGQTTNDSVSAISSDLNQIPDDTAALNQAASSSAAAVNGF
ncbi:hypothetical protein HKL94_00835 [Candidatus Parcubacteria bacterium]|nr:hypothetical protein [Candidatus Parcubacteria bacterium]